MVSRRNFINGLLAAGVLANTNRNALANTKILKAIPGTEEKMPAIGLGSWQTFNVTGFGQARANCTAIIRAFFDRGGTHIDSSPMYGWSQTVIGIALQQLDNDQNLYSATKVWIPGAAPGRLQMESALDSWGLERFDLMHVHNMLDWETHLPWMQAWRDQGRIRYLGISTSHGRRHEAMLQVIDRQPFDVVQFTYNLSHREAENALLPRAMDAGKAVIINRPFDGGRLFQDVANRPLPDWAPEINCENWAQFFLKFVIAHPAVTCAIPATSQLEHLHQNMGALQGALPDQSMRREMVTYYQAMRRS